MNIINRSHHRGTKESRSNKVNKARGGVSPVAKYGERERNVYNIMHVCTRWSPRGKTFVRGEEQNLILEIKYKQRKIQNIMKYKFHFNTMNLFLHTFVWRRTKNIPDRYFHFFLQHCSYGVTTNSLAPVGLCLSNTCQRPVSWWNYRGGLGGDWKNFPCLPRCCCCHRSQNVVPVGLFNCGCIKLHTIEIDFSCK